MKRVLVIIMVMMMGASTQIKAQGFFSNFFSQKKAMLKNAAAQIAALKVYASYLEKGYDIAHKGLTTISDIKRGDFSIHSDHFASLMRVNPVIKKYARVADIISLEIQTVQVAKNIRQRLSSSVFSTDEMDYISRVMDRLILAASETLDDLMDVVTSDRYQLTDDERIGRIDRIYDRMLDQYEFTRDFGDDVSDMSRSGERALREIQDSKILNGLEY